MTERTYKWRVWLILIKIGQFLILVAPLLFYGVKAFITAGHAEKLVLTAGVLISLIMLSAALLQKARLRSPLWIVLLVIYYVLREVLPLMLFIAIGTILDELVLTPAAKFCKQKYSINREIDKRL